MLDWNVVLSTIVSTITLLGIWAYGNRLESRAAVLRCNQEIAARLDLAKRDIETYERYAQRGASGFTSGGNLQQVKFEFHDWLEGFSTALHAASVPFKVREALQLSSGRIDSMLRDLDPNHEAGAWSLELKARANRWI
jgi:hypothetical protein